MSMPRTGIALVGLGYWGPNHLRVLQESDQAELRWICDADRERLEKLARRTQTSPTTDIDAELSDPRTDAVVLATPISTHHELTRRCLEAGKHVLVEKPLADSLERADDLIALANE